MQTSTPVSLSNVPDPDAVRADLQKNLAERRLLNQLYKLACARQAEQARLKQCAEKK